MQRMMFGAAAIGAAFLLSVCGRGGNKNGDFDKIKDYDRHESAQLKIALHGSQCVLTEAPEQIRARWGQRVAFVIEGACNQGDSITIGQFQPDSTPFDTITPVAAQDGQVLIVKVKPRDKGHGLWHYEVLVNGNAIGVSSHPAQQSSFLTPFEVTLQAAAEWDFAICPTWPCNN